MCLELPEDEVHQCHSGHCFCLACWKQLKAPQRCPCCRQSLPVGCRNRVAERAIAALEWRCGHCADTTTRGERARHLLICPQQRATCSQAGLGCAWEGVRKQKAPHEATCTVVIGAQMVAPLLPCNRFVSVDHNRVRPVNGHARQTRQQQRQQQPEADPHDAPPSDVAMGGMDMLKVVAALREHLAVQRVVENACRRLAEKGVCGSGGSRMRAAAAGAGAIEAVTAAMLAYPGEERVQADACEVLRTFCAYDIDEANEAAAQMAQAHTQRASAAYALDKVVAALRRHPHSVDVQSNGCEALGSMCDGDTWAALVRRQRAVIVLGAIEVVVSALRSHRSAPWVDEVQARGCFALGHLCGGTADTRIGQRGAAEANNAVHAGGLKEVVAAMRAHPDDGMVQRWGGFALRSMCRGGLCAKARWIDARREGARAVADAIVAARDAGDHFLCLDWARAFEHGQALIDSLPDTPRQ